MTRPNFQSIFEQLDLRASAGNGHVLMDQRVGHQFPYRDAGKQGAVFPQGCTNVLVFGEQVVHVVDQPLEPHCIAPLPVKPVGHGARSILAAVRHKAHSFACQAGLEVVQTHCEQDGAKMGNVPALAHVADDQAVCLQLVEDACPVVR